MASVRRIITVALAALLAWTAPPAWSQHGRFATPAATVRIDGLDVEEVAQLSTGTRLNFSLFGTSEATASLQIDGARHGLLLHESDKGVYEGTYTIDPQDRIRADGKVVATLRRGADVAQATLEEPLVLGASPPAPLDPRQSAPDPRQTTTRQPPVEAAAPIPPAFVPPPAPSVTPRWARTVPPAPAAPACADCAVVESIRAVESGGRDGIAGAIGGGLLGAVLGNQIGHGDMRQFARIVGAVGGLLVGREIERASSRRIHYDVVLRLPSGASRVHSYDSPPPLQVGDTVRLPAVTYARAPRFVAPY